MSKVLFPDPPEHGWIVPLETIWEHSDSIQDMICAGNNGRLYLKIKDSYIHYELTDLRNSCEGQPPFCFPLRKRDQFEVLVNRENDILVEGKISSLYQLDSLFQLVYLNSDSYKDYISNPKSSAISLKWDIQASKDTVKCVIRELMLGYEHSIVSIYGLKYGEYSCDSISNNLEEIQDDFPFNLQLSFGRELTLGGKNPPPPPPPPFEF